MTHDTAARGNVAPTLLAAGLFLGVGLPISRALAARGVEPLAFALWPTLAAGALLGMIAWWRQGSLLSARLLRFGSVAGLLGYALPMTLAFWLAARAGAGFAAIAFTLPPIFTLAITLALGLQRWSWRRAGGIATGLAGAALLVGQFPSAPSGDTAAIAAVFAVPALIGAANVYRSRYMPPGAPPQVLGALTLLSAAACLAVAAFVTGRGTVPAQAPVMAGLGLQGAALVAGYVFYFRLQQRADPVVFSLMGYVTMLTGTLGGLLLGETVRWTALPAAALILLAVRVVQR